MNKRRFTITTLALCSLPLLCGFLAPQCIGGFQADDFVLVSERGFDAADNHIDKNHYAWAMKYFQADGDADGYVYVGTGNNIAGLIGYYMDVLINGGDILDSPVRPPEIRRYRPDLGPTNWEKVFDYRDVECGGCLPQDDTGDEEFLTTGFRFMTTLTAADNDKNGATYSTYIYAASQGLDSVLWRSKTGDYGDWEDVHHTLDSAPPGQNGSSIRWIEEHDGRIYLAIAWDTYEDEPPAGEIWVSDDGLSFAPLMTDGFGNPNNRGVQFVISYNGWLYAGTKNDIEGFEIWKLEGPDKQAAPIKVVDAGGPSPRNEIAGTPIIFNGELYVGSIIFFGFNPQQMNGFKGCDIIRIDTDDNWETVVGPNSTSGYGSGFNHFTNAYLWWMEEHDGWLYAGTWDQGYVISLMLDNIELLPDLFPQGKEGLFGGYEYDQFASLMRLTKAGADIFKTQDGDNWFPVTLEGMDNIYNYGWRSMESTPDGELFVGSANPVTGLEVYRATTPVEAQ